MVNTKEYENLSIDDENRFYPRHVPIMIGEPLRTNFALLQSPEPINFGIVSLISFKAKDLVAQCTGEVLNFQTLHSLQHTEKIFYHDDFFAGYLLHSCDPNCVLNMEDFSLYAIKDIRPFERLTIDYELTEAELFQPFHCTCGSDKCKGFVQGYKFKKSGASNED